MTITDPKLCLSWPKKCLKHHLIYEVVETNLKWHPQMKSKRITSQWCSQSFRNKRSVSLKCLICLSRTYQRERFWAMTKWTVNPNLQLYSTRLARFSSKDLLLASEKFSTLSKASSTGSHLPVNRSAKLRPTSESSSRSSGTSSSSGSKTRKLHKCSLSRMKRRIRASLGTSRYLRAISSFLRTKKVAHYKSFKKGTCSSSTRRTFSNPQKLCATMKVRNSSTKISLLCSLTKRHKPSRSTR